SGGGSLRCGDTWNVTRRGTAMANLLPLSIRMLHGARRSVVVLLAVSLGFSITGLSLACAADMPLKAPAALPAVDWTGFYVGGHFGYAGGTSNWTGTPVGTPGSSVSGSLDLFQPFGPFDEAGSYFAGV